MLLLLSLFALLLLVNASTTPLKDLFPDRNERQKYLKEFALKKGRAIKSSSTTPATRIGTLGNPIKLLFWNADLGFGNGEVDFGRDPSWTMDCPVDCLLMNRREALDEAHVVVYTDLADKRSLAKLNREWQRSVVYARTPVMYYQERELSRADWLVSFNNEAHVRADLSHQAILAALYAANRLDLMQEELLRNDPADLWTRLGLLGRMPTLEGRMNNTVAVFLEDCISFDGARAKRFVEELQKQFSVHTYGACFRGSNSLGVPPNEVNVRDPLQVVERMKSYRFVLVLEHTRVDNYVTEQLYYALAAGAIPIYVGAPNIKSLLTSDLDVIMNVDGGMSARDLAYELHGRKADDEHWQRFQWWRGKGHFPFSTRRAVTQRTDSVPCQICKLYKHHLIPDLII